MIKDCVNVFHLFFTYRLINKTGMMEIAQIQFILILFKIISSLHPALPKNTHRIERINTCMKTVQRITQT